MEQLQFKMLEYPAYFEQSVISSKISGLVAKTVDSFFTGISGVEPVLVSERDDWGVLKVFDVSTSDDSIFLHIFDGVDFRAVYLLTKVNTVQALKGLLDDAGYCKTPSFVINKKEAFRVIWQGVNNYVNPTQMLNFEKMYRYQHAHAAELMLSPALPEQSIISIRITYPELFAFLVACAKYVDSADIAITHLAKVGSSAAKFLAEDTACLMQMLQDTRKYLSSLPEGASFSDEDSGVDCEATVVGFTVKTGAHLFFNVVKVVTADESAWDIYACEPTGYRDTLRINAVPRLALRIRKNAIVFEGGWWQDITLAFMTIANYTEKLYARSE